MNDRKNCRISNKPQPQLALKTPQPSSLSEPPPQPTPRAPRPAPAHKKDCRTASKDAKRQPLSMIQLFEFRTSSSSKPLEFRCASPQKRRPASANPILNSASAAHFAVDNHQGTDLAIAFSNTIDPVHALLFFLDLFSQEPLQENGGGIVLVGIG